MKIALLGAIKSLHLIRWINALASRGHEVHVFSIGKGNKTIDNLANLNLLPFATPLGYFVNAPYLRSVLKKLTPEVFHVHYASGYGTLGRLCGYRPYVLSIWGSDVYDFPYKSPIHHRLLISNLRNASCICSTSRAMADHTRQICPKLENCFITPFGTDLTKFKPQYGIRDPNKITIGTVKGLFSIYGIDILIEAFSKAWRRLKITRPHLASKLRLLIVGGGPEDNRLKKLAKNLGIEDFTEFTGHVPHSEVTKHLNRLDIYVAVSRSESFGVAVLEASACGIAVVVSDVGGLPEVVENGQTGLVVKHEDPNATALALLQLISNNNLRERMGQAGRCHVEKKYSWEKSISIMEAVYEKVADV